MAHRWRWRLLRAGWQAMSERNPIPPCLSHLDQLVRPKLIEAWHIAKDGALLPPDGGSPSAEEIAVSVRIANRIRALIQDASLPILEEQ